MELISIDDIFTIFYNKDTALLGARPRYSQKYKASSALHRFAVYGGDNAAV